MRGKTHLTVGLMTAMLIMQPLTRHDIFVGTIAAAAGAVISDIDTAASGSRRKVNFLMSAAFGAAAAAVALDYKWNMPVIRKILEINAPPVVLSGAAGFFLLCLFGRTTRHRTFMHSLTAMFLLSLCSYMVYPPSSPYFLAAFASHILLDMLNKKTVNLFWPLKGGAYIGLCSSKGLINRLLFWGATMINVFMYSRPVLEKLGAAGKSTFYPLTFLLR